MLPRMRANTFRTVTAALLAILLAACTNYDFAAARKPSGEWDFAKLASDLERSGANSLRQGTWIPLIHMAVTTFTRNDPRLPPGYTLGQLDAFGPLFCVGGTDRRVVDEAFAPIEGEQRDWIGWGLCYYDLGESVETTHGRRHHGRDRVLLLFGGDSTHYVPATPER